MSQILQNTFASISNDLFTSNTSVIEILIRRDRSRCLNTRDPGGANLIRSTLSGIGSATLKVAPCDRRGPRLPHTIPPCYYALRPHTRARTRGTDFAQSTRAEYESRDLFLPRFTIPMAEETPRASEKRGGNGGGGL